ncbi:MAG: ABC transporter substrate-binding protein [Planctomycetaceae bacterium]|nr:ABC transporter substrate-binding protein [Planctomycetaceae bacterium]
MRIVSLCPSLTELVFELGLGSKLVGVTEYCIRPADGVLHLAKVGGTKDPNLARIAELRPDLVLMNEEENRREDADELARLGLETHATFPCTVEETAATVREIGRRLAAVPAAERIAEGIEAALARAAKATACRPPLRFAYVIWRKPWMTAAEGTYVSSLLEAAGGDNVVGPCPSRYPAIGEDQLAAANPGAVLLATEPFPFQPKHVAELSQASGISACRFRIADGELLSWHGARTAAGLDYAVRLLDELRGARMPQRAS